ncbi:MAG: hypothetical protein COB59_07580 [Rhodospirillaceae bacterium]|nr:MAG: hypothetical protein COB59_07580 [Rhodospirillaceae bacterium]
MRTLRSGDTGQNGQSAIETGLVAGLMAVMMVAVITGMVQFTAQKFDAEAKPHDKTAEFNARMTELL